MNCPRGAQEAKQALSGNRSGALAVQSLLFLSSCVPRKPGEAPRPLRCTALLLLEKICAKSAASDPVFHQNACSTMAASGHASTPGRVDLASSTGRRLGEPPVSSAIAMSLTIWRHGNRPTGLDTAPAPSHDPPYSDRTDGPNAARRETPVAPR